MSGVEDDYTVDGPVAEASKDTLAGSDGGDDFVEAWQHPSQRGHHQLRSGLRQGEGGRVEDVVADNRGG